MGFLGGALIEQKSWRIDLSTEKEMGNLSHDALCSLLALSILTCLQESKCEVPFIRDIGAPLKIVSHCAASFLYQNIMLISNIHMPFR